MATNNARSVYNRVSALLGTILSQPREALGPAFRLVPPGADAPALHMGSVTQPAWAEQGVTPMDIAKLAIACEQAFGIALYDEKIAQWETVGDVCRHIEELLDEGQAEAVEHTDEDRTAWYYE